MKVGRHAGSSSRSASAGDRARLSSAPASLRAPRPPRLVAWRHRRSPTAAAAASRRALAFPQRGRGLAGARDRGPARERPEGTRWARSTSALARNPNFRLGHLIRATCSWRARASPIAFGARSRGRGAPSVAPLQDEARVRLQALPRRAAASITCPRRCCSSPPRSRTRSSSTPSRSRLFVYANDARAPALRDRLLHQPRQERRREAARGRPEDARSASTRIISSKEKLPDFYGPRRLPDQLSQRVGQAATAATATASGCTARPRRPTAARRCATDGCVVLTNDDLARLSRYVDVSRTPVVIGQIDRVARARRSWEAAARRRSSPPSAAGEPTGRACDTDALPRPLRAGLPLRAAATSRRGSRRSAR